MKSRRILLVSPRFHGYWKSIGSALEAAGHEVVVHCYDHPQGLKGRAENKLLHELPERLRWSTVASAITQNAVAALENTRPDVVVVVKGDQLEQDWWEAVQRSGAATVTWLYDELRRMRYSMNTLAGIGPIASYSPVDTAGLQAAGIHAEHIPLAYDHRIQFEVNFQETISLVGARYPSREETLRRLSASGVPVKAFGKSWSRHVWDVLRTKQLRNAGIASGPDLSRSDAYGVMAGSPATLNLHGDQDGFTMRTFEAPGVGALQITDRLDVAHFFEIGTECLAFADEAELVDLANRAISDVPWARNIREAGRKRALAEHTFDHRIQALESMWA